MPCWLVNELRKHQTDKLIFRFSPTLPQWLMNSTPFIRVRHVTFLERHAGYLEVSWLVFEEYLKPLKRQTRTTKGNSSFSTWNHLWLRPGPIIETGPVNCHSEWYVRIASELFGRWRKRCDERHSTELRTRKKLFLWQSRAFLSSYWAVHCRCYSPISIWKELRVFRVKLKWFPSNWVDFFEKGPPIGRQNIRATHTIRVQQHVRRLIKNPAWPTCAEW